MKPDEVTMTISGRLDENTSLPQNPSARVIHLDLSKLKSMNSIGIRNFLAWCDLHKNCEAINLLSCPSQFIKNVNFMGGIDTANITNLNVISFWVPFFSEHTEESTEYLFVRDRDFFADGKFIMPRLLDSEGHQMEVDVHVSALFKFLKKSKNT